MQWKVGASESNQNTARSGVSKMADVVVAISAANNSNKLTHMGSTPSSPLNLTLGLPKSVTPITVPAVAADEVNALVTVYTHDGRAVCVVVSYFLFIFLHF